MVERGGKRLKEEMGKVFTVQGMGEG